MWNCYERFHPLQVALPKESSTEQQYGNYHGEAYMYETNEVVEISELTPNKMTIIVSNKEGMLMLNQNYVSGWKVMIDGKRSSAVNTNGLVSAAVTKDNKEIVFYYLPNSFIVGLFVTMGSIIAAFFFYILRPKT